MRWLIIFFLVPLFLFAQQKTEAYFGHPGKWDQVNDIIELYDKGYYIIAGYEGDPYHFGFLDYALNKVIFLMPGESKTLTGIFDGTSDHGGQTYSDITSDNIMVISTTSNFKPHYSIGYQSDEYTQRYFAFYVDQTTAATPN